MAAKNLDLLVDPDQGSPRQFDRYEIRERLGEGSAGVVYRAFDRRTFTEVALKTFRFPLPDPEEVYRLKREFRSVRDISHANLARLYDLEISDRQCFFTMELIEGANFLRFVTDRSDPQAASPTALEPAGYGRLLRALPQLVSGLEALHRSGSVHRDLKPANVLVDGAGRVVIVDFGLAAAIAPEASSATESPFAGTFAYMAPEQACGHPATAAGDWYSVGVMLFEVLTGVLPFSGSAIDMLQAKMRSRVPRPTERVASVPPALDEIVWKLLDPTREQRPGPLELLSAMGHVADDAAAVPLASASPAADCFVGRASELARLRELVDAVRAGEPMTAHIRGPSGIGKSELLRNFLGSLRASEDVVVLRGVCHPRESVAYKALDSVIDELSHFLMRVPDHELRDLVPRQTAGLLRLFPVLGRVPAVKQRGDDALPAEPAEVRRQGLKALRELMTRLSSRWIVLLWIDDAQWGDRDSALLLREMLRQPGAPRCLLLLSYRGGEAADSPLLSELRAADGGSQGRECELDVGPLAPEETRRLVDALLIARPPDSDKSLHTVVTESEGSPFFAGELVRYLASRGQADSHSALSIAQVVRARLRGQSELARDLLELVAISGGPIPLDFVLRLDPVSGGERALVHDLCGQCLLRLESSRGDDQLDTYHDRIRDTVLAMMDAATRRTRHRTLADGLRAAPAPDAQLLVQHYLGAGDDALAAEYAVRAGGEAHAALAFDRAAELYGLALRLRAGQDTDFSIRVKLAEALGSAGRYGDSGQVYEEAAHAAGSGAPNVQTRSMLRGRAAEQYLYGGYVARGMDVLHDVLRDIGVRVPPTPAAARRAALRLRLRFVLRGTRVRLSPPGAIAEEALVRLDTLWRASKGTAMLDGSLSDLLVVRHLLGAMRVGEPSRLLRALGMEANIEASLGGQWLSRRSRRILEAAAALAQKTADPYDEAWISGCRGTIAYFSAQWTDCLAHSEEAVNKFRTRCAGVDWEMNVNYTFGLLALAHLGRIRELTARLPALLEEAKARGDLYALAVFRSGHTVLVPLAMDDPAGALRDADATLASIQSDHVVAQHFHHLIATVQTHLYVGDTHGAWDRLTQAWESLQDAGFLSLDCLNLQLRYLRSTAALAGARAGGTPGWTPERLVQVARTDARKLSKSRLPIARPLAAAIEAGLAHVRRDSDAARVALTRAVDGFAAADMALHCEAARVARANLMTDERGREDRRAGLTWMESEGIRNPAAMLRLLMPSFDVDRA